MLGHSINKPLFNILPVHDLPNLLHVLGSHILVVDVVGVFPHVDG